MKWGCPPMEDSSAALNPFHLGGAVSTKYVSSRKSSQLQKHPAALVLRADMSLRPGEWILEAHLQLPKGFVSEEALLMWKPM